MTHAFSLKSGLPYTSSPVQHHSHGIPQSAQGQAPGGISTPTMSSVCSPV